jgi:hypothetical protein
MSNSAVTLQNRIEQSMGRLIKEAQAVWEELSKLERERRVAEYQLLRNCLTNVAGEPDPVIPSPWSEDEVFDSMRDYPYEGNWLKSTNGMLTVIDSKLVVAVRAAERSRRRSRKGRA